MEDKLSKYENAKDNVTVGTVLWEMRGRRSDDTLEWYAQPFCVEHIDKNGFLFGNKTGGSWGLIGKMLFFSREEAVADFLKDHDRLIYEIDINDKTPDGAYELPRTDWQDYEITLFDGVAQATVYCNGFNDLINVTSSLKWRDEACAMQVLTLREIFLQVVEKCGDRLITVFINDPMHCEIFQCNNYEAGHWVRLGRIQGYA